MRVHMTLVAYLLLLLLLHVSLKELSVDYNCHRWRFVVFQRNLATRLPVVCPLLLQCCFVVILL